MNLWKRLSLKAKTITSLGTVFVLMVGSILFSIFGANKISDKFDYAIHGELAVRDMYKGLQTKMLTARRHEKDYLLRGKEKYLTRHAKTITELKATATDITKNKYFVVPKKEADLLHYSLDHYAKGFKGVVENIAAEGDSKTGLRGDLRKEAHNMEKAMKAGDMGPYAMVEFLLLRRHEKDYLLRRTEKYLNKVNSRLEKIKKVVLESTENTDEIENVNKAADNYKVIFKKIYDNYNSRLDIIASFRKDIHTLEKINVTNIKKINDTVEAEIKELLLFKQRLITLMASFSGLGILVLMTVIGYYLKLSGSFSSITDILKNTTSHTKNSSHELKNTAEDLSSSVAEQSAAILETVSTLDEIKEMMKRSVENAQYSEQRATESHGIATEGKTAVSEVVNAINDISDCNADITNQMDKTSNELQEIVAVIREISAKTQVINDIVFQTKLLSFNASVEAARAGEHGKGFAVVAEEVGNLAQMSGTASQEIEELITSSVSRVEAIVDESNTQVNKLVDLAKGKTEVGVNTAQKCNKVLDDVVNNVGQVKDLMKEISGAASEQAVGIENISEAMNELDASTHLNTNIANNTALNSDELAKQTMNLNDIVESLETVVLGGKGKAVLKKKAENVIDISTAKKAKEEKAQETPVSSEVASNKVVVGSDIPSADDSRFEDI